MQKNKNKLPLKINPVKIVWGADYNNEFVFQISDCCYIHYNLKFVLHEHWDHSILLYQ